MTSSRQNDAGPRHIRQIGERFSKSRQSASSGFESVVLESAPDLCGNRVLLELGLLRFPRDKISRRGGAWRGVDDSRSVRSECLHRSAGSQHQRRANRENSPLSLEPACRRTEKPSIRSCWVSSRISIFIGCDPGCSDWPRSSP